jgi:hypothetical protein
MRKQSAKRRFSVRSVSESGVSPPWTLTTKSLNLPPHCASCTLPINLELGRLGYFYMLFTVVPLFSRHFLPLPLHHDLVLHRDSQAPFGPDYDIGVPACPFLISKRVYFTFYLYCHL